MFPSFLPNSEVTSGDPELAGHTIKGRDFQEKYLNKLFRTPQIVGVFLQDRVSSYVYLACSDTDHHRVSHYNKMCIIKQAGTGMQPQNHSHKLQKFIFYSTSEI